MGRAIEPRDYVFLVGVGTTAEPMEDDWLLTRRGELHLRKIWMSSPSRLLAAGDHVFVVRAARRGNQYGDVIMLAEALGPVVRDPHEWPEASDLQFGFPLRPLVVVDGASARRAQRVRTAPRSGLWKRTDAEEIAELYAAVEHGVPWPDDVASDGRPGSYEEQLAVVRRQVAQRLDPAVEPVARRAPSSTPTVDGEPIGLRGLPSIRSLLSGWVGRTIATVTGAPNTILSVDERLVLVGTDRSPAGTAVPLDD